MTSSPRGMRGRRGGPARRSRTTSARHPVRTRRPSRTRRPIRTRGPVRTRERAAARRQPPRRRGRYARRTWKSRLRFGKSLIAAIAVAVGVVAGAGYLLARHHIGAVGPSVHESNTVAAAQFVYTERTANDAAIVLPSLVQYNLRQIGQDHQSIELTAIGDTGNVSTSSIDMTPRTGNSSNDPPLKVGGRINQAINKKISGIETAVNSPAASGGQALYAGLTKIDFTTAPVTIISTGIDLENPDNFRSLQWSVPAGEVVATVQKAGAQPALHGPVTFVLVPVVGPQPQLEQAQKDYLESVWRALLKAAGATSVQFVDATATASSAAPSAPTVAIPSFPGTPVPQVHRGRSVTCTVPDSYFIFGQADLVDPAQTVLNLTPCITDALTAHATFALDGWASYEGPLNAEGKPEFDYVGNYTLSEERVKTIVNLLVDDLGVPQSAITRETAHGNLDQPNPDPRSPANRVVVITYTTK